MTDRTAWTADETSGLRFEVTFKNIYGKKIRTEILYGQVETIDVEASKRKGRAHLAEFVCRGYYGSDRDLTFSIEL